MSLPTKQFDSYMEQLLHHDLREKSHFSLQDGKWSSSVTAALEHTFDKLLTSMLLRYLTSECDANQDQKFHIVKHTDTRLNFAVLIGCAIYASPTECELRDTLDDAIKKGWRAGCKPITAENCSLAYYGFVLKKALVKKCRSLNVEERHFAASMKAFCITYQDEKVAFKASLTHGFGAPEIPLPRGSLEETSSGLQHANQAASDVQIPLYTHEKKTLQPVHLPTLAQVARNGCQYMKNLPHGKVEYVFNFSRVKNEDFDPENKRSPRDFEQKIEFVDDSEARPSAI